MSRWGRIVANVMRWAGGDMRWVVKGVVCPGWNDREFSERELDLFIQ